MNMYDIITKKKHGETLSAEEIRYFVDNFTSGLIPDYQASALLMAICLKLMDDRETADLTKAMMHSGDVLDLSLIQGIKVDKHSTGGVGDKTTLVLAPMLSACGLTVAKMSGRALGHTGGTIDKLESISGFRTELSEEAFINQVNQHKIAVAAQTKDIAPADKKLYALRDVTATVDNMSLIASSIMSKKLACGADAIVLDVKTGSGSFAGTYENSLDLAEKMVSIGKNMGKKVCGVITDMNQPLGNAVGNALEVMEAIETLQGRGPSDLLELCLTLGGELMCIIDPHCNINQARSILKKSIDDRSAFEKFVDLIKAQGGSEEQVRNTQLMPHAKFTVDFIADTDGFVNEIQCNEVGMASLLTGAGREIKDAPVDPAAGIYIFKKIADKVSKGERIARLFSSDEAKLLPALDRLKAAYHISHNQPQRQPLIYTTLK